MSDDHDPTPISLGQLAQLRHGVDVQVVEVVLELLSLAPGGHLVLRQRNDRRPVGFPQIAQIAPRCLIREADAVTEIVDPVEVGSLGGQVQVPPEDHPVAQRRRVPHERNVVEPLLQGEEPGVSDRRADRCFPQDVVGGPRRKILGALDLFRNREQQRPGLGGGARHPVERRGRDQFRRAGREIEHAILRAVRSSQPLGEHRGTEAEVGDRASQDERVDPTP